MANPLVKKENTIDVAMVMLPYPAQGHINPLLHLSHRLVSATRNITVYFTGTAPYLRQTKGRVHGWDPSSVANMHLHELSAPQHAPTIGIPPNFIEIATAVSLIREPFYAFVNELATKYKRVVVVYDYLMSYIAQDIYSVRNVEAYRLQVESACYSFCFHCDILGKDAVAVAAETVVDADVAEVLRKTLSTDGFLTQQALEFSGLQENARKVFSGDIYNSNREIEGLFFDLVEKEKARGAEKVWCLGPLNPISVSETSVSERRHESLVWLDKQEPESVIYVSFGTTSSFSDEQIIEIANGLERSEQKFLWVLRSKDGDMVLDNETAKSHQLPLGFEERTNSKGIVIRDWAPQLEILGHSAIGGTLSHCGWNSCIESISNGVAIATWPMICDQPRSAALVTKVLKIGIEVFDWESRGDIVTAGDVEKAVRTLMASEEGGEMRRRAKVLGEKVMKSLMEGGNAKKEFDLFIAHITR